MRSFVYVLVLVSACGSSRVPGGGDDDDEGVDAVTAIDATSVDAANAGNDASVHGGCANGLERIAEWPVPVNSVQSTPALALTPAGDVVAAYNREADEMVLATRDANGAWPATTIDAGAGSFPSLGFWSDGTTHACFVRAVPFVRGTLVCGMKSPSGTWSTRDVDTNPVSSPSLAVDPVGEVHVAYARPDSVGRAWTNSGIGWSTSPLPVANVVASSLAYDAQRGEHIVWAAQSSNTSSNTSLFDNDTGLIDADAVGLAPRSLAIDAAGREHLVYVNHGSEHLEYAVRDPGGAWQHEHDIDGAGFVPPWTIALALGADGAVHVTYYHRPPALEGGDHVRHAVRAPGGGWTTEDLYVVPRYNPTVTAIVAGPDRVHIAFDAATPGQPPLRTVYYVERCDSVDPL
jgi:hypothetical protein